MTQTQALEEVGIPIGARVVDADGAVTLRLKTDSDDMHKVSRSIFFAFEKEDQALLELSVHKASLEDVFLELTESGQAEESKQYTEEPNETEVDA